MAFVRILNFKLQMMIIVNIIIISSSSSSQSCRSLAHRLVFKDFFFCFHWIFSSLYWILLKLHCTYLYLVNVTLIVYVAISSE